MAKKKTAKEWTYGDPAPKTHHDLGQVIKGREKKKRAAGGLFDRLDAIEKALKEKA